MKWIWQQSHRGVEMGLIAAVRFYQLGVSGWLGPRCRYQPTCSQYFIEAVRQYGPIRGSIKGIGRICRCHPLSGGGYDPVK